MFPVMGQLKLLLKNQIKRQLRYVIRYQSAQNKLLVFKLNKKWHWLI
uniref:Uncharacterized protein MANES_11G156700 n=1 Tax=Rhizophora mucronata TaxID=61149 RepID=A0A2P2KNU3_RHIMU